MDMEIWSRSTVLNGKGREHTLHYTHHLTNGEIEEGKIYENQTKNKQNGQANTNNFSEPMFIAFIRTSVIYKKMRR